MAILKKFALSGAKAVKPQVPVGIVGVGSYLPPKALKNEEFRDIELSEDGHKFIQGYFGLKERRYAVAESFTDMQVKAAQNALEEYNIDPKELDLVISTHVSRDMARLSPPNANYIQTKIGADNATSFNVDAGFNGWLNSVITAAAFIGSGFYETILVVSGETPSKEMDCTKMNALIFGDGAGAFIIKKLKNGEEGLLAFHLMARECRKAARAKVMGGYGNYFDKHYDVRVFNTVEPLSIQRDLAHLEKRVPYSIEQSVQAAGLANPDVDWYIFAQQFLAANRTWAFNLGIGYEKVIETLAKYACMKTVSIPVNTHEAIKQGKLKKGDIVAFGDQGANWSIASAIFRWCI